MKAFTCSLLALLALNSAFAARVGDTYAQVLAEKGKPSSEVTGDEVRILNYPDASIRVKDDVVIAIKTREEARGIAIHVVPRPAVPAALHKTEVAATDADAGGLAWTSEYSAALERAKAEKRNVFLFFTGSDWCSWCQKLDREILSTADFSKFAQEKLVLVKLDFPHQIAQSEEVKTRNLELARKYHVQGYPTVVVLDPSGKAVRRLGYQEGGPAPFLKALESL